MLEIEGIDAYYTDLQALWEVSMQVNEGELDALVGPNGAGKTTTLRAISGLLKPAEGSIRFNGKSLAKESANKIVELGISQVPEGGRIFTAMSVLENLELGAFVAQARREKDPSLKWVFEIFPRLEERKNHGATEGSGEKYVWRSKTREAV